MIHQYLYAMSYIFLMMTLLPETETARLELFQYGQKREATTDARKYCGSYLTSALQNVCDGVYNSRFKKSNQEMEMDDFAFNYDLHPYKSAENAWKMIRFRRDTYGVYQECCVKACSTDELRTYCAPS